MAISLLAELSLQLPWCCLGDNILIPLCCKLRPAKLHVVQTAKKTARAVHITYVKHMHGRAWILLCLVDPYALRQA